ncbi:MAG: hypothetical protein AAGF86_12785 [Pseudomonadota bacterium]
MYTIRHYFWFIFWIGVFIVGYLWSSASSEARYGDLMRRIFHVPDHVAFADIRYPRRGTANGIEGIFQLTDAQMSAYQARFNDPNVWHTSVELRRRTFEGPYAPTAFAWKSLPSPGLAGNRRIRWGNLSRKEIYKIKNGVMMCVAFRNEPGKRKSDWWYQAPKGHEHRFPLITPSEFDGFNAIHCADVGRSERPPTLLQAVLDLDTRRLQGL